MRSSPLQYCNPFFEDILLGISVGLCVCSSKTITHLWSVSTAFQGFQHVSALLEQGHPTLRVRCQWLSTGVPFGCNSRSCGLAMHTYTKCNISGLSPGQDFFFISWTVSGRGVGSGQEIFKLSRVRWGHLYPILPDLARYIRSKYLYIFIVFSRYL